MRRVPHPYVSLTHLTCALWPQAQDAVHHARCLLILGQYREVRRPAPARRRSNPLAAIHVPCTQAAELLTSNSDAFARLDERASTGEDPGANLLRRHWHAVSVRAASRAQRRPLSNSHRPRAAQGLSLQHGGDLSAAASPLLRALHAVEATARTGRAHDQFVDVVGALSDCAALYVAQDRPSQATQLVKRALYLAKRAYRPDPHLIGVLHAVRAHAAAAVSLPEARKAAEEAVTLLRAAVDEDEAEETMQFLGAIGDADQPAVGADAGRGEGNETEGDAVPVVPLTALSGERAGQLTVASVVTCEQWLALQAARTTAARFQFATVRAPARPVAPTAAASRSAPAARSQAGRADDQ